MDDNFKKAAKSFLEKNGEKVHYGYGGSINEYGWADYNVYDHMNSYDENWNTIPKCSWKIKDGATLREETYSMFNGTFVDNTDEVLLIVDKVDCACGKYKNVEIAWSGSLQELMSQLFGGSAILTF